LNVLTELSKAIGWLLAIFYSFIPNLGVAIILLTCTVMLVLFPLTAKQARSMIAMQRVQPEIKKIQAKYKDDKQKQNEEVMRFYQENKINPLSGCFPLLMQMPIFFALFGLLHHTASRIPKTGKFNQLYTDICPHATAANHYACPHPQGLKFLGMDLSVSAAHAGSVTSGFLGTLPYFLMVGLVILTGWYQARQTMARQNQAGANASPMANQAQMIGKVMPIAFGLISLNFASGLVVYFVTSNSWRIGQQQLVLNKIYDQEAAKAGPKANLGVDVEADAAPKVEKPEKETTPGSARRTAPKSGGGNTPPAEGRVIPGAASKAGSGNGQNRARPNPNTAQRKKKRKR
jgi:YidC/Oxa1 family membrane protein insertase